MRSLVTAVMIVACSLLAGCYQQGGFRAQEYGTRSIVALPPLNKTPEISAPYEIYSSITRPLADRGYYVYPVAIVDQFMKDNGLPTAGEMHAVPLGKIHEIIGADAVLYPTVVTWDRPNIVLGVLAVLAGAVPPSTVAVGYRLVDVKTGDLIWECVQSAKDTKSLRKLGKQCNLKALGGRLPPGPRHPAYRGPLGPLMDTTAP